jgi:murein DD-endopeptidase MepM/ murein hydrolase activator NlpD
MATYQIKKGDTLSGIAKQYGVSVGDIASANGISNPNKISAGATLTIPGGGGAANTSSSSASYSSSSSGGRPAYAPSDRTNEAYEKYQTAQNNKPNAYQESQTLGDLRKQLEDFETKKPGDYQSAYKTQIDEILGQILGKGDFNWDPNKDQLYQSMADQYRVKGNKAMRDTMGSAAAMTGGYGSSYATTAGQQAYDDYMQQWADRATDYYNMALQQYNSEMNNLNNKMSALRTADDTDYGRYRDTVNDWYTDRNYLTDKVNTQYDNEYGQYRDTVSDYYNDLEAARALYQQLYGEDWDKYQSDLSQYNTDRNYDFEVAQADREYQLALKKLAASGSKSSGKSSSSANKVTGKSSSATTLFQGSVKTPDEWRRYKEGTKTYDEYLDKTMQKWNGRGDLSDSDVAFLIEYYGL